MNENSKYLKQENFEGFIDQLHYITIQLKKLSSFILILLLAALISMILFAFSHKYSVENKRYISNIYTQFELPLLIITFVIVVVSIMLLYRFNNLRDRGMILYEEITDEIDWSRKRKEFMHRPSIELRITIKEFLKSTDLPFTSGKNGQALYIFLLMLIAISTVLIKILL